jgi:hypothetical protein
MANRRSKTPIHHSIKAALGYSIAESDDALLQDWRERKTRVCKPCWELKYCPYGPLVEQSPILPAPREGVVEHINYYKKCLSEGTVGNADKLSDERRALYEEWILDEQILLSQAVTTYSQRKRLEQASSNEDKSDQIEAWFGELPPIHIYRTAFDLVERAYSEGDFDADTWTIILQIVDEQKKFYRAALDSGIDDNRQPLETARRTWFERQVEEFNAEDYPETVPETFEEAACNVFGHICPVFFAAEALTETEETRRIGRRPIPFASMMRIVRRDDYRCQHCKKSITFVLPALTVTGINLMITFLRHCLIG